MLRSSISLADICSLPQGSGLNGLIASTSTFSVVGRSAIGGTGGPATGTCKESEVIIAGSDRVAVDAVGVSILKFHNANGIKGVPVKDQEQIKRASEIGIGNADYSNIIIKESDLVGDTGFKEMVQFVKNQLI